MRFGDQNKKKVDPRYFLNEQVEQPEYSREIEFSQDEVKPIIVQKPRKKVAELQKLLNTLGLANIPENELGFLGPKTAAAVAKMAGVPKEQIKRKDILRNIDSYIALASTEPSQMSATLADPEDREPIELKRSPEAPVPPVMLKLESVEESYNKIFNEKHKKLFEALSGKVSLLNEAPPISGEAGAAKNVLGKIIGKWQANKMSDDALKAALGRAFGSGGAEGKYVDNLFDALSVAKKNKMSLEDLIKIPTNFKSRVAQTATKATGTAIARVPSVGTSMSKVVTPAARQITTKLLSSEVGKKLVTNALAKRAAELAAGQAIGSIVPGFGNIVMGVITGATLGYDLMMLYYDQEKIKFAGPEAGKRVRVKCENLENKGFPEETGNAEEYKELAKDFANAIAFSPSYTEHYKKCLLTLASIGNGQGKTYLSDAGLNIDLINDISPSTPENTDSENITYRFSCRRCRGVSLGCSGKDVKEVQDQLIKLGFITQSYPELEQQKFGDFTKKAVENFQRAKKLKVDGIVGPRTCIAMGLMKRPAVKQKPTATPAQPAARTPVAGPEIVPAGPSTSGAPGAATSVRGAGAPAL